MKLMGSRAADGAGIRFYRAIVEADSIKDAAVSLVHLIIGLLQRVRVEMEGVGVLHDELTGTHQAKAWTGLVTKLGLNLVEIHWQLFIATHFVAGQIGDHFFVSRAKAKRV